MHTVIVANSPTFEAAPFEELLRAADLLVAADGGGNALHVAGIRPQVVIGDLDSLLPAVAADFAANRAEIRRYPAEKDETDLELALLLAVERGATAITVLGAMGGRWDQALSNVALLALPELAERMVRLLDREQQAYLARGDTAIPGAAGDTLSLLPLGGAAHGITTQGLQYPLHEATLHWQRSRGVSNLIVAPPAAVRVREGTLLVVHSWPHS